jgi:adenosylmethionine-8-amino-7-oxononanoate aminotransferase
MVGIELHNRGEPFASDRRAGHKVTLACRKRGVVMRNIADVLVLMPAPAMPIELVIELSRTVCESITDVLAG